MKKILLGTTITLALLLSGCSENKQEKQGREAFKQNVEINDVKIFKGKTWIITKFWVLTKVPQKRILKKRIEKWLASIIQI